MNEKSITPTQLYFVIFQSQLGIGLLSLPYVLHQHAKSDGWISILVAGILLQISILIIWLLLSRFKGKTIYEINQLVFGKYIGRFINACYILFFILVNSLVTILFAGMLKKWILSNTPQFIIFILLITIGIYLGKQNLRVIARFYTIATGFTFLILALPFFSFSTNLQYLYLLPIGQSGVVNILKDVHHAIIPMMGFEILMVIHPFVQGTSKQILKMSILAVVSTTLYYFFFTIISFMVFSPDEIKIVSEPVLYLLKAVNFRLIERLDLIFLSIWIIPMSTSYVTYIYLSSAGVSSFSHKVKRKYPVWIISIIVFFISLIPKVESDVELVNKYISIASYIFIGILPLLILLISMIFKTSTTRSLSS